MLLAAMLVDALHAALEDRVEAFDRVRVDLHAGLAVRVAIFAPRMLHGVVSKVGPKATIIGRFVGHDMRFSFQVCPH
jgi:hypothetical protein